MLTLQASCALDVGIALDQFPLVLSYDIFITGFFAKKNLELLYVYIHIHKRAVQWFETIYIPNPPHEDHLNVFPFTAAEPFLPHAPLQFIVFVFLFMSPIFPFDRSRKWFVVMLQKL